MGPVKVLPRIWRAPMEATRKLEWDFLQGHIVLDKGEQLQMERSQV